MSDEKINQLRGELHGSYERLAESLIGLRRVVAEYGAPRERYETTISPNSQVTADGSGNATVSLGPPVQGRCWYVERITKHASAGTPTLAVLVGPQGVTDASYRRDFSAASADDVADEVKPIYVGPGEYLVLQWAGASASAVLSAGLQIRVHVVGSPAQL